MALLIGSILMMALHAMVVSTARMMRRAEVAQVHLRAELAAQRALRRASCHGDAEGAALPKGLRTRRIQGDERDGRRLPLVLIEKQTTTGWRVVASSSDRCGLPERCEWDNVARACRDEGPTQ
jgi:hypothetical protein